MNQICCVILNYNDADNTVELVHQIEKYASIDHIIIVDNASTDDSCAKLNDLVSNKVSIYKSPKNGGYGYGNNYGLKIAKTQFDCKYAIVSNPDVRFEEKSVKEILSFLQQTKHCVLVSPVQITGTGKIFHKSGWYIPSPVNYFFQPFYLLRRIFPVNFITIDSVSKAQCEAIKVDCIAGSFYCVDIDFFWSVGGYDENVFLNCEETIMGIKFKNANLNSYILPYCTYRHYHDTGSINSNISSQIEREKLVLKSRYYTVKTYMTKSKLVLLLGKISYPIAVVESIIKMKIRTIAKRFAQNTTD